MPVRLISDCWRVKSIFFPLFEISRYSSNFSSTPSAINLPFPIILGAFGYISVSIFRVTSGSSEIDSVIFLVLLFDFISATILFVALIESFKTISSLGDTLPTDIFDSILSISPNSCNRSLILISRSSLFKNSSTIKLR